MKRKRSYLWFFAVILAICVAILIGSPQVWQSSSSVLSQDVRGMEIPSRGAWDAENSDILELECVNLRDYSSQIKLSIFDFRTKLLGEKYLELPAYGSQVFLLNEFPIEGTYGTYLIEDQLWSIYGDAESTETAVNCHLNTKRLAGVEDRRSFQYLNSSIVSKSVKGVTSGIFNTNNPLGVGRSTKNYLTVYNLDRDRKFNAKIVLYDTEGTRIDKSYKIKKVAPGGAKRFEISSKLAKQIGYFVVDPYVKDIPYVAVQNRYGRATKKDYNFSVDIPTVVGSCHEQSLEVETGRDIISQVELSNISSRNTTVDVRFSSEGTIYLEERIKLSGFSSKLYLLEEFLPAGKGVFSLKCVGKNVENRRKVVLQELVYTTNQSAETVGAKYQAATAESELALQYVFPVNTSDSLKNTLKLTNFTGQTISLKTSLHSDEGSEIVTGEESISLSGHTKKINLEEIVGPDFIGSIAVSAVDEETKYYAELIRSQASLERASDIDSNSRVRSYVLSGSLDSTGDDTTTIASTIETSSTTSTLDQENPTSPTTTLVNSYYKCDLDVESDYGHCVYRALKDDESPVDDCSSDSECNYKACKAGVCQDVAGQNSDQCYEDRQCFDLECVDGYCQKAAGSGSTDEECSGKSEGDSCYPTDVCPYEITLGVGWWESLPGKDDPYYLYEGISEEILVRFEASAIFENPGPEPTLESVKVIGASPYYSDARSWSGPKFVTESVGNDSFKVTESLWHGSPEEDSRTKGLCYTDSDRSLYNVEIAAEFDNPLCSASGTIVFQVNANVPTANTDGWSASPGHSYKYDSSMLSETYFNETNQCCVDIVLDSADSNPIDCHCIPSEGGDLRQWTDSARSEEAEHCEQLCFGGDKKTWKDGYFYGKDGPFHGETVEQVFNLSVGSTAVCAKSLLGNKEKSCQMAKTRASRKLKKVSNGWIKKFFKGFRSNKLSKEVRAWVEWTAKRTVGLTFEKTGGFHYECAYGSSSEYPDTNPPQPVIKPEKVGIL